jgi:hypothetical protein
VNSEHAERGALFCRNVRNSNKDRII